MSYVHLLFFSVTKERMSSRMMLAWSSKTAKFSMKTTLPWENVAETWKLSSISDGRTWRATEDTSSHVTCDSWQATSSLQLLCDDPSYHLPLTTSAFQLYLVVATFLYYIFSIFLSVFKTYLCKKATVQNCHRFANLEFGHPLLQYNIWKLHIIIIIIITFVFICCSWNLFKCDGTDHLLSEFTILKIVCIKSTNLFSDVSHNSLFVVEIITLLLSVIYKIFSKNGISLYFSVEVKCQCHTNKCQ